MKNAIEILKAKQAVLLNLIRYEGASLKEIGEKINYVSYKRDLHNEIKNLKRAVHLLPPKHMRSGLGVGRTPKIMTKSAAADLTGLTRRQGKIEGFPITIYRDQETGIDYVRGQDVEAIERRIDGQYHAVHEVIRYDQAVELINICKRILGKNQKIA